MSIAHLVAARGDPTGPAVVATDVWTYPGLYLWRPVASSFDVFARMLGSAQPEH